MDMDGYKPTNELRFVRRWNGDKKERILQQRWESRFEGEDGMWLDVPVYDED